MMLRVNMANAERIIKFLHKLPMRTHLKYNVQAWSQRSKKHVSEAGWPFYSLDDIYLDKASEKRTLLQKRNV